MFKEYKVIDFKEFPNYIEKLLNRHKEEINKVAKDGKDYNDTIKILDDLSEELDTTFTPLSHINSVLNSKETQEAYEKSLPLISKFYSFISQHEELYKKIKSLKPNNELERRVLELEVKDFELSGINLPKEKQKELEEIDLELSQLSNQFSQNLLDATNSFELIIEDFKDVQELPQSSLNQAKFEENGKIKYRFTLQIPSYLAYMTYGSNREYREKLYKAYNTRAPQNQEIIDKILSLKDKKAKLLGFKSYAEYALQTRDANSEDEVLEFLYEIANEFKPYAQKELNELKKFAKELDNIDLQPYDLAYYSEKLKKRLFDFDENDTKPYFEQNSVLNGMLKLIGELFNVEFKEAKTPTWHESVKVYDIIENNRTFARIYFDLEARESKRGGAWMHNWQSHYIKRDGITNLASAFVVANFEPSSNKQPSLLRHDDVVTLFHEMGHAIHHLFSKVSERSISGIEGVAWDVVEFPSQFLENFAYEPSILKEFAYHYQTKEPISDELLQKIKDSKNFQAAMQNLRQVEFALFDFKLHQKLYQGEEVQKLLDEVRDEVAVIKPPKYVKFQHGFSHIFAGGYAAGYYSYKWAEVFSADAFFTCLNNGKFDVKRANEYKNNILEKGATKEMSQLYKEWLNRRPKISSLLKLYGVKNG